MPDALDHLKAALADRYALERELGAGGMATVYLAQDLKHERPVALKVLKPELAAAMGHDRFLREIKTQYGPRNSRRIHAARSIVPLRSSTGHLFRCGTLRQSSPEDV